MGEREKGRKTGRSSRGEVSLDVRDCVGWEVVDSEGGGGVEEFWRLRTE